MQAAKKLTSRKANPISKKPFEIIQYYDGDIQCTAKQITNPSFAQLVKLIEDDKEIVIASKWTPQDATKWQYHDNYPDIQPASLPGNLDILSIVYVTACKGCAHLVCVSVYTDLSWQMDKQLLSDRADIQKFYEVTGRE